MRERTREILIGGLWAGIIGFLFAAHPLLRRKPHGLASPLDAGRFSGPFSGLLAVWPERPGWPR
jgi:hypothetical protein